jgi:hypothetical protein
MDVSRQGLSHIAAGVPIAVVNSSEISGGSCTRPLIIPAIDGFG